METGQTGNFFQYEIVHVATDCYDKLNNVTLKRTASFAKMQKSVAKNINVLYVFTLFQLWQSYAMESYFSMIALL